MKAIVKAMEKVKHYFIPQKMVYYLRRKLHFITLNYTSYYTLNPKLFKCMFCIPNYNSCYTLLLDVKFVVNFD